MSRHATHAFVEGDGLAPLEDTLEQWGGPDAPPNSAPLFRLWKSFGFYRSMGASDWAPLKLVLERLPPLNLIHPAVDKPIVEAVVARHLAGSGARPRPVKWFPDIRSARAAHPAVGCVAQPAFPWSGSGPGAYESVWLAGDTLWRTDWKRASCMWQRVESDLERADEPAGVRVINSLADQLLLFAAGLFYYAIMPDAVVCVVRPSLWLKDGALHRADGPAVEWPTGEHYYFWKNIEVPSWIIESPERITREGIRAESDRRLRHCMMERFGMERFNFLEHWEEWQDCYDIQDFRPFLTCSIQSKFTAVSDRLLASAEASIGRISPADWRSPIIDKSAVAFAMARFLQQWGFSALPIRWFEDGRSAREYIEEMTSVLPMAAYWPRLQMAPLLDAAWYRDRIPLAVRNNVRWLQGAEDWQDWSITQPRAVDCHNDPSIIESRCRRQEHWAAAKSCLPEQGLSEAPPSPTGTEFDAAVRRWTPLIDAFEAGLFYYWIGPREIVCIPRPSLWMVNGQLHREDGPAVEWETDERYCFWRGIAVPNWIIEQPNKITPHAIGRERNVEIRRCMIERIGYERFLHEGGARLVTEDQHGKLWLARVGPRGMGSTALVLEVENGTREPDGTRRKYFLSVPPTMRSSREAVAWTYGLSTDRYEIEVRT